MQDPNNIEWCTALLGLKPYQAYRELIRRQDYRNDIGRPILPERKGEDELAVRIWRGEVLCRLPYRRNWETVISAYFDPEDKVEFLYERVEFCYHVALSEEALETHMKQHHNAVVIRSDINDTESLSSSSRFYRDLVFATIQEKHQDYLHSLEPRPLPSPDTRQ